MSFLRSKRLFMFDVDGVFMTGVLEWRGEILGGYRLLRLLRGRTIALVGSGSNWSTREYWYMIRGMGFPVNEDEVWVAPRVAGMHLRNTLGRARCLVIGEGSLRWELRRFGHTVVDHGDVDAVVVGHDRFLNGEKLRRAIRALEAGAYFLAVNRVRWYYTREGPMLSPGSIVRLLEEEVGREAVVAGKPSPIHFTTVLNYFGVKPRDAVMVGDTVDTDLAPAKALGMNTVLVSSMERWDKVRSTEYAVDLRVNNIDELTKYLEPV
jgi:HAD superfamily hydrolase (TIGR01450 family)